MRKKTGIFALVCAAALTVSLSAAAEGEAKSEIKRLDTDGQTYISCDNAVIYAASYDDGILKSVSIGDGSIAAKLNGENRIFFWDKDMAPLAEPMNISTKGINIFTVTEYDMDLNTITVGDNTYTLSERFTGVANGVSSEQASAAEFIELIANKKQYLGENILLADTDADGKYDMGAYDYYGIAVVDEIVTAADGMPLRINFTEKTMNIKARLSLGTEDAEYKFTLDGKEISAADIEPYDILTIRFDPFGIFDESPYYDVTVSRRNVHGYVTKAEDVTPAIYTINGESYAVIDELVGTLTEKAPYDVYLDASGKIAYALIDQYERPIGILTNIYKASGENVDAFLYTAELINRYGETVKYNISSTQADEYLNMLESYTYLNCDEMTGLAYNTEDPYGTRLYWYPQQVVTYYVDPDTGAFEIISPPSSGKQAFEAEFKASTGRLDGVVMDADADIIDISGVDKGEENKHLNTVPDLVNGGKYTLFAHLMSYEEYGYGKFTFAVLTDTVYVPENPDTPGGDDDPEASDGYRMAVLQSAETVTENGTERTKWTLLCDDEEKYFIVNEDVAQNTAVHTGDPLIIDVDKDFEICKAVPIFSASNMLGTTFADFRNSAISTGFSGILSNPSGTYWNNLLPSDGAWTQDMLFGVLVNRSGNKITLCTSLEDGKYINLDRGRELYGVNTSGLCYTYAFRNGGKMASLTKDDAPASTPAFRGAITTRPNGNELLDITNEDVADDLIFAAVRVEDDEIVELYQIYYDYD